MMIQKKMAALVIILTVLCLLAPTAEAKAAETTGDITYADRDYYTVVIPAEVIVKDTEKSENLTLSVTTRQNCNVEIKVESDNDYKLYNGRYSVSYAIPDKDKELVFSNENSEDKKQDYSIDISVTGQPTVSGEYTDRLTFIMTGKEYYAGKHRLSFDMNCSDSVYTDYKLLDENESYGILPTPERDGYAFDGWYTSAAGGDKAESDTVMGSTDTVVYAHWTPYVLTINYHNDGAEYIDWDGKNLPVAGEDVTKFQKEKYGSKFSNGISGLYDAWRWHKTGYTTEGSIWITGNNDKVSAADDYDCIYAQDCAKKLNVLDEFKKNDVTVDLYPIWKANIYYVNYDKNADDAAGSTASSRHTYDEEKALTPNGFHRTGYEFLGWSTRADASTPMYADKESVINLSDKANASVTLYAAWQADTETIQYDSNSDDASGSMEPTVITYGTEQKLALNRFVRDGYTFICWNEEADGTGTAYEDGEAVENLTDQEEATVTLYAQWKKDEDTVKSEEKSLAAISADTKEIKNEDRETVDTTDDNTNESDETKDMTSSDTETEPSQGELNLSEPWDTDISDADAPKEDKNSDNTEVTETDGISEDADIRNNDIEDKNNDNSDVTEKNKTAEDTVDKGKEKVSDEFENDESEQEAESKDTAEEKKSVPVWETAALTKSEYDFETE